MDTVIHVLGLLLQELTLNFYFNFSGDGGFVT